MSNDALGGYHGDDVAELVEIRNTHGRGEFPRTLDRRRLQPERLLEHLHLRAQNSAIVGLNSRLDSGFDQRTPVQTNFAANTVLVELTGNAADATVDPGGNIPEAIRVNAQRPGDDARAAEFVARQGLRDLRPGDAAGDALAHATCRRCSQARRRRTPPTARRGWPTST